MPVVRLVDYERRYRREGFCCGRDDLDEWLRQYATQAEHSGNCRTVLAVGEDDVVIGYVSLVNFRLEVEAVQSGLGLARRTYPMPALLLARLAVDRSWQGRGLGTLLLLNALERAVRVADLSGCEVLVVHALDTDAAAFYGRHGFIRFADNPQHLFMTLKDVRATLETLSS